MRRPGEDPTSRVDEPVIGLGFSGPHASPIQGKTVSREVSELIISNEEVRRSLKELRERADGRGEICAAVSPEHVAKIKDYLQGLPETREPIVSRLKGEMARYPVDPMQVADKMVGRAIGDMVR